LHAINFTLTQSHFHILILFLRNVTQ
jgi:hypothetical protein